MPEEAAPLAGRTIVVADDEPSIVMSLEFLLRKAGARVVVARDGDQALAQTREVKPDLLLLDVMMPGRDGFDVIQELRRDPATASLPVIMLTAKSREVERQKGIALGATDYVTKPFSTRELVETVRRHLSSQGVGA